MEKQQKKEIFKKFKNRAFVTASTAAACSLAAVPAAFAADETTSLATNAVSVVEIMKNVMSLFSTFPLNIFLTISIIVAGVGVIKQLQN